MSDVFNPLDGNGENDDDDDDERELNQIPEGGELWLVDDAHWYIAFYVPDTDVPLLFHVRDNDDLEAIVGESIEGGVDADRSITRDEINDLGGIISGAVEDIALDMEDPWRLFEQEFERYRSIQPWMDDPEVLAKAAEAWAMGRPFTADDLALTEWWQSRTHGEREWAELAVRDPATAEQQLAETTSLINRQLHSMGMEDSQGLGEYWAKQFAQGSIGENELQDVLTGVADPFSPHALHAPEGEYWIDNRGGHYFRDEAGRVFQATGEGQVAGLERLYGDALQVGNADIDQAIDGGTVVDHFDSLGGQIEQFTHEYDYEAGDPTGLGGVEQVRDWVDEWLGPALSAGWEQGDYERWAGRIRHDENAWETLQHHLRDQRNALLPGYDENLSWADIAQPWHSVVTNAWGTRMDEDDPLFLQIVRMNDISEADRLLRREGMKRGVGTMADQALESMGQQMGGGVRGGQF